MHDEPVPGAELKAVEINVMIQPGGKHETSVLIRAIGRQRIFHWNGQNLIGLAALPAIDELRRRRFQFRIAFGRARFGPIPD